MPPRQINAEGAVFALTITLTFQDRWMIYHSVNTTPGLGLFATSLNHDHLDGAVTPVFEQSRFNQISVRRLDDDTLEVLEMKDGDVIVLDLQPRRTVLHPSWRRQSPDGRSKAFEEYFERGRAQ